MNWEEYSATIEYNLLGRVICRMIQGLGAVGCVVIDKLGGRQAHPISKVILFIGQRLMIALARHGMRVK